MQPHSSQWAWLEGRKIKSTGLHIKEFVILTEILMSDFSFNPPPSKRNAHLCAKCTFPKQDARLRDLKNLTGDLREEQTQSNLHPSALPLLSHLHLLRFGQVVRVLTHRRHTATEARVHASHHFPASFGLIRRQMSGLARMRSPQLRCHSRVTRRGLGFFFFFVVVALTSVRATMRRQRGYKKGRLHGWRLLALRTGFPSGLNQRDQDAPFELRTHPPAAATAALPRPLAW